MRVKWPSEAKRTSASKTSTAAPTNSDTVGEDDTTTSPRARSLCARITSGRNRVLSFMFYSFIPERRAYHAVRAAPSGDHNVRPRHTSSRSAVARVRRDRRRSRDRARKTPPRARGALDDQRRDDVRERHLVTVDARRGEDAFGLGFQYRTRDEIDVDREPVLHGLL